MTVPHRKRDTSLGAPEAAPLAEVRAAEDPPRLTAQDRKFLDFLARVAVELAVAADDDDAASE